MNSNVFHCPVLQGVRNQYEPNFTWSWLPGAGNPGDRVGYGANTYFNMSSPPYSAGGFATSVGGFNYSNPGPFNLKGAVDLGTARPARRV